MLTLLFIILLQATSFQTIQVNNTVPCFLNETAGAEMWKNCGARDDFLSFALLGFEWATGGNFSMLLVSVLILFTYIKYHKVIYPIMIGFMYIPTTFFLFPSTFQSYGFIFLGLAVAGFVFYMLTRQTKEYN